MTLDPASYRVVYVDHRVSEEKDLTRDDALPVTTQAAIHGDQFRVDNEEVLHNLQSILSIYNSVSICISGPSCVSKLTDLHKSYPAPTLLILDIPNLEPGISLEGSSDDSCVPASNRSDPLYGLSLLRFVCLEIEKGRISDMVIPVALVSSGNSASQASNGSDDESTRIARCVDCGALDVLVSPLTHDRVKALGLHCYRVAKRHFQQTTRARKLSWVGVPEIQKTTDYSYLREKMVSELMTDIVKPKKFASKPSGVQIQVSPSRTELIRKMVGKWHFSAHEFTDTELLQCAYVMFEHAFTMPEIDDYRIPLDRLTDFLITSRGAYNEQIPYHNFRHVVDVLQACFVMLVQLGALPPYPGCIIPAESLNKAGTASLIRPVDALILMIAAVGHDVGHPGVNNAFLVKLKAPLAQVYNDKSVLESFHCAAFSQVLRRHWPESQDPEVRKLMIDIILATDMGLHFEYMARLDGMKRQLAESPVESWDEKTTSTYRTLICSVLIKCADISNVARGHDCAAQWATILIEEFSRQASLEKELEIPSSLVAAPMMGNILALAKSQTGFMGLFAIPLFQACADIMPALKFTVDELTNNIKKWNLTIKECEERNISAAVTPKPGDDDEPEITLIPTGSNRNTTAGPAAHHAGSETISSHRSSYEWSDRSGNQDISRRSSTTVPSDIPIDRPPSASSAEHSTYKPNGSPSPNGYMNGSPPPIQIKSDKATLQSSIHAEKLASSLTNGHLTVNTTPTERPTSHDTDHSDSNGSLGVSPKEVERRPSRFFKKFWKQRKHTQKEES